MLTQQKLNIYQFFHGDPDGWARAGTVEQHQDISSEDWVLIDNLLRGLVLCRRNLVSMDYQDHVMRSINSSCDNEATVQKLIGLVELLNTPNVR